MKIGSVDTKPVAATAPAERRPNAAPAASAAGSSTQVDLSSTAVGLAEIGADPSFDSGKVERIAQAIREGKFTINAEAIADKLIINAEELLGRKFSS
ncbi:MAG TPA: flagellar biosynthesis anti-sigma factor FlgM [Rubrivivax sp.]|jgi:negative regulator of flagellin synthesis FlgM|nr:flagellar biosynthesis anti-sigma factor FlgM [Rubrivivax sp.]